MIGPNAAGKSTLMKLMLGHLAPTCGTVTLDGHDVASLSAPARAAIVSYVPQRAGVSFGFSVQEIVTMGRHALSASPQAVEASIQACELDELRNLPVNQLSFGQQQRVLLARAMAQSSGSGKLMLLDEPGSAMDLWHVHRMMQLLAEQAAKGLAVLIILHDLNLALRYADDAWLVHEGRLVAAGTWREVMTPKLLEPVYRVQISSMPMPAGASGGERPIFRVEPPAVGVGVQK
jgi:iron complex transport system ATP-binding protein